MDDKPKTRLRDAIEGVMSLLEEEGFSRRALSFYSLNFGKLAEMAKELGVDWLDDRLAEEFVSNGGPDDVGQRAGKGKEGRERCVRYLRSFIATSSVDFSRRCLYAEPPLPGPFADCLAEFDELQADRGLAPSTLAKYHRSARLLLEYLRSFGRKGLADVLPGDVTRAVEAMARDHSTPTTLYASLVGLRAFCSSFGEMRPFMGEIPERTPKGHPVVEVFDQDERARISGYVRSGSVSKRDEAICLLSLEAGMRGADICNLKVGDIDWRHDSIHIVQTKTKRPLDLPLRPSYGNAIACYLMDERPNSDAEWLFLAAKAPHGKLSAVGDVIRRAVEGAGVELRGRSAGPRAMRHSAASAMLREGSPLPAISGMLGHANPDSTMVYITTQAEALAALTLPLPGVDAL